MPFKNTLTFWLSKDKVLPALSAPVNTVCPESEVNLKVVTAFVIG